MPLTPATLSDALAANWLPGDDGPYPDSVAHSAAAFAGVVADWYQSAAAAGVPCATAQVKRPILTSMAIPALMAQGPHAAGSLLANAVAIYMTGQVFGPMSALPPVATPFGISMFSGVFAVMALDRQARAQLMGNAIFVMAISSVAVGPAISGPVT